MPGRRLTPAERSRLAAVLVDEYADRKTIRELSRTHGISYGTARGMLLTAGVTLRPRGGGKRRTWAG